MSATERYERGGAMKEIKYKNATVRIHGSADRENLKKATEKFAKAMTHHKARCERRKEKTA